MNGGYFVVLCGAWLASEGLVNGRTRNRKQFSEVADGITAAVVHPPQLLLLLD